ncbi:unnamed protein product [Cyprideis torosa]|uniref:Uncharacterized protein n=1 Tax=Cyprideis torosa TaxID=163714 RepID=A0A7R8W672_9CRUS|nr:unnamed protein product [Cyprideis torosa]CAG0886187.1 unnamed protein product [Cyprideis torosa]
MFIGPSLGELEPSSPLVCSQCGEVFSTSKSWHHHLQTVHSRFYCKDCAARFKNQKSLELHKLSHRKIKSGVSGLSSLKSDPLDVSAASERKSLPPETRSRRTSEKMFKNEEAFVLDIIERVKQECRGTDLTRRG